VHCRVYRRGRARLADTLNALMAIPNLIALAMLSPVVFALSR
jgi:alanine or glycine:cation symporter, AGCS family